MDFLIPLLGGAVGAALVNGLFAHYKLRHDKLTEHDQWRRNQRQIEYSYFVEGVAGLLTAVERISARLDTGTEAATNIDNANDKMNSGLSRIGLIAPESVMNAATAIGAATGPLIKTCTNVMTKPDDAAAEAAYSEASLKFRMATGDFKVLARQDLGLLTEGKGHDKALEAVQAALLTRHQ